MALPSGWMSRSPSGPSGRMFSRRFLMVALRPDLSSSSQWAPSNTGDATQTDGSVMGRVVAAGQLVALGDLALLGDVDPDQLVHARRQLVLLLSGEDLDVDDLALLAVGHLEAGVADLTGLLAEDGPQQALLGGQLGLALGRDLADQHVAGTHFGADADDPPLVEVLQDLLGQVGDVPR